MHLQLLIEVWVRPTDSWKRFCTKISIVSCCCFVIREILGRFFSGNCTDPSRSMFSLLHFRLLQRFFDFQTFTLNAPPLEEVGSFGGDLEVQLTKTKNGEDFVVGRNEALGQLRPTTATTPQKPRQLDQSRRHEKPTAAGECRLGSSDDLQMDLKNNFRNYCTLT